MPPVPADLRHAEPVPPSSPVEGECCESGCGERCVWVQYAQAREAFEKAHAAWRLLRDAGDTAGADGA